MNVNRNSDKGMRCCLALRQCRLFRRGTLILSEKHQHLPKETWLSPSSSRAPETSFCHQLRFLLHTRVKEPHSQHQHQATITKSPNSHQDVATSRPSSNPPPLHSTASPPTPRPPNNPHRNRIRSNHVLGRKLESRQHGPQRPSKEHHLAHSRFQQFSRQSSLRPSLRRTQPCSRATWRKRHPSVCE